MGRLKIFNSLTRKKERFKSDTNNQVGVYVCGITPYDITHLGHAFTYVSFDVAVRYLRYLGYRVTYVQNLTDIDDDILRRAKESKKNWRRLGEENAGKFLADMKRLNNVQPDVFPRATDHIPEMIAIIKNLLKRRLAYEKAGSVYFAVKKDRDYGKLSRLSKKQMLPVANERGNDPKDPNKRNPLDFVLWQAEKPGEPSWFSPWGRGRPGWHIECSAMSMKYLGQTFDIQGGGSDLIFPHHESSLAQSECAVCKKFVNYWMHTGMLRYQGKKMSKSLGNMVFVSDLKKKYSPNTIRLFLLSHQYRSVWEFFERELMGAQRLSELFQKVWQKPSGGGKSFKVAQYEKEFFGAMNNDFDTKGAIKALQKLANQIVKSKKEESLAEAKAFLNKAFNILGLLIEL